MVTIAQHNAEISPRAVLPYRLRVLKRLHRMKQGDIARALHVSQPTVSYWMTGRRSPDVESLVRLADLFETSTDFLLGRSNDPWPHISAKRSTSSSTAAGGDHEAGSGPVRGHRDPVVPGDDNGH